jgi:hypothetical protein
MYKYKNLLTFHTLYNKVINTRKENSFLSPQFIDLSSTSFAPIKK